MLIGPRLRELRESQNLSQGDIESRTGLLRCYVSRVENGHTVPTVQNLERWAHAFHLPLYKLFYEGKADPQDAILRAIKAETAQKLDRTPTQALYLEKLRVALARAPERDRKLILLLAKKMAGAPTPNQRSRARKPLHDGRR